MLITFSYLIVCVYVCSHMNIYMCAIVHVWYGEQV